MRGSEAHELLIERTIYYLRKQGYTNFERGKKIPMEQNNYYVDILAYKDGKPVPVECGSITDGTRIPDLLKRFEKVIHIGFSGRITVFTVDMGVQTKGDNGMERHRYGSRIR